jgi:hypothetical protein
VDVIHWNEFPTVIICILGKLYSLIEREFYTTLLSHMNYCTYSECYSRFIGLNSEFSSAFCLVRCTTSYSWLDAIIENAFWPNYFGHVDTEVSWRTRVRTCVRVFI